MVEGDGREIGWLDQLVDGVRRWHDWALTRGGGASGERPAVLQSCCARPFQTAFGEDLFPRDIDKAAALFHAIVANHPFVDGNKRTATLSAILFLAARDRISGNVSRLTLRLVGDLAVETATPPRLTVEDVQRWLPRVLADVLVEES